MVYLYYSLIGSVTVILGAHSINVLEPEQKRYTSTNIVIHPGWDEEQFINDVALVILPSNVQLDRKYLILMQYRK